MTRREAASSKRRGRSSLLPFPKKIGPVKARSKPKPLKKPSLANVAALDRKPSFTCEDALAVAQRDFDWEYVMVIGLQKKSMIIINGCGHDPKTSGQLMTSDQVYMLSRAMKMVLDDDARKQHHP